MTNQKVLLCDCKGHTARHVASTRFAVRSGRGRGVPQSCCRYSSPNVGYPSPVLPEGVPLFWGTPLAGTGVPAGQDWGTSPGKGPGTRDLGKNLGLGYHLGKDLEYRDLGKNLGLVPSPVDRHTRVKNSTFAILRMRPVIVISCPLTVFQTNHLFLFVLKQTLAEK